MLVKLQNTILEMIAKGVDLRETVDFLCRSVEANWPHIVCSVLALDPENRLRHLAGPSLPEFYTSAIDGVAIGLGVGSCGTAAFTGKPVIVSDIETHPYWAPYKQLAHGAGVQACWSTPIISSGKVLGTFAFYYRTKREPGALEQQIVDACVHLCAIAIERDQRVAERQRLAQTDALTQLPNRAAFNEAIARIGESGCPWGLLLADVDNLKLINDRFGHQAGDDLIVAIAMRLTSLGPDCRAFRIGGDEFAVLTDCEDRACLSARAERLLGEMKPPATCAGQIIYPSVTMGGAIAEPGQVPDLVRQNADHALYHAKERARGTFVNHVAGLGGAIARRYRSIQDVTEALREDRIEAHFQPVVDLLSGRIAGMEALCRIRTDKGELIAAGYFQEAITDGHIAFELTQRMLEKVARNARRWIDMGLKFGRVGVNLSAADFYRGNVRERVSQAFGAAGVPLNRVTVEVTESVYLDQRDQTVADQIRDLREAGVAVGLDDFGTGYASLTHLLTVPVDIIKIDKCFVQRMIIETGGAVIIKGLVEIAHGLGIGVVAEGVETAEQRDALTRFGCDKAQGFLYSRAMSPEAVEAFFEARTEPATLAAAG